jgi:NAD(P)-dependent dehydrogenase (short-subunit alcohol dehydrogenase family)
MPRSIVDDMVRQVNGGEIPEATESGWQERITDGRFSGRTVIVTGAGSGIGKAVASRLAREGARVVAVDIAADRLAALPQELGPDVVTVTADLSKPDDIAAIIAAAGERIDGLANVAGINDDTSPLHEVTDQMWSRVLGVNLDGVMRLTRAVLPAMLAAGGGSIVNIASEAALRGNASGVAYTVSKHAVVGLTRSAAFMYGPKGIRINAVAPGGVATGIPMAAEPSAYGTDRVTPFIALIPGLATAAQLAASVTFLLSDDGVNINGAVLPSDGGWSVQ